jgi:phosphoesterase RecJ-like protein
MDEISDEVYNGALAIVLDTSAKSLISDERYTLAEATARMDHHLFVEKICDEEITATSYESCAGLVAAMAEAGGLTVSPIAAKALYTGMITDSGRFRYDSTSAETFRVASFLMERKFGTSDIYRNLYADELFFIQLRAKFVLKIQLATPKVAYIYTEKEEAKSYGADNFTISRGMVNVMGEIKGIESWVNFTETDDGVLCEIRSNTHNINPIAVKYGGGGHQKASGATLKDKDEAMKLLSDLIAQTEQE